MYPSPPEEKKYIPPLQRKGRRKKYILPPKERGGKKNMYPPFKGGGGLKKDIFSFSLILPLFEGED